MGLDAIAKRYFVAVIFGLIASAAYFQAHGMGQLIAATVATTGAESPRTSTLRPAISPPRRANRSAEPILARNAFDSITGPLDGKTLSIEDAQVPLSNSKNPYDAPACDAASVTLIMAGDDPEWSFAAITDAGGESQLRRIGQDVGGHKVEHIGWYEGAVDPRPRVWLTQGGARCQLDLNVEKKAATPKKRAVRSTKKPSSRRRGGGTPIPDEIASKIRKISETQYELDRSVVDQILGQQALLMKSVRLRPDKDGGMTLRGIRGNSVLGTLGLKNGDQLVSINGFDMSDPEKALEAYTRLRTADGLQLAIKRKGKDVGLDYAIK